MVSDWWKRKRPLVVFYGCSGMVIGVLIRMVEAGGGPDPVADVLTPAICLGIGIFIGLVR